MRALRYVSLAVWLFAGPSVYGQFSSKTSTTEFRGRLIEGNELSYDGYAVEITNLVDRSIHDHADVFSDGTFVFRSVADGDYMLQVLTLYGAEVTATVASIGQASAGATFDVRLPQQKLQKPVSGTVSAQLLAHPFSKELRKLLDSGQKLIDQEHFSEAVARFREAAREDPQCAQAHAQLGLSLARMENWNDAIEEYKTAISLDSGNTLLHSNLSAILASAKRFDEAAIEAAAALKIDPRNPRAHFVMAGALLRTNGKLAEVVSHLVAAEGTFPSAHGVLEQICAQQSVHGCP